MTHSPGLQAAWPSKTCDSPRLPAVLNEKHALPCIPGLRRGRRTSVMNPLYASEEMAGTHKDPDSEPSQRRASFLVKDISDETCRMRTCLRLSAADLLSFPITKCYIPPYRSTRAVALTSTLVLLRPHDCKSKTCVRHAPCLDVMGFDQ